MDFKSFGLNPSFECKWVKVMLNFGIPEQKNAFIDFSQSRPVKTCLITGESVHPIRICGATIFFSYG